VGTTCLCSLSGEGPDKRSDSPSHATLLGTKPHVVLTVEMPKQVLSIAFCTTCALMVKLNQFSSQHEQPIPLLDGNHQGRGAPFGHTQQRPALCLPSLSSFLCDPQ
jgi:hypothetical protein